MLVRKFAFILYSRDFSWGNIGAAQIKTNNMIKAVLSPGLRKSLWEKIISLFFIDS